MTKPTLSIGKNYLLLGRRGLPMLEDALAFARAYLGLDFFNHPDYLYVGVEGKKSIGVGDIAPVLTKACSEPILAEKSLVIIERFDMLTEEAQNKLLLSIESSNRVCIIGVVEQEDKVLDTVKSRCFKYIYTPFTREAFRAECRGMSDSDIDIYYVASHGCPGRIGELTPHKEMLYAVRKACLTNKKELFSALNLAKEKDKKAITEHPSLMGAVLLIMMDALTKKASVLYQKGEPELAEGFCSVVSSLAEYYHNQKYGGWDKNQFISLMAHIVEL